MQAMHQPALAENLSGIWSALHPNLELTISEDEVHYLTSMALGSDDDLVSHLLLKKLQIARTVAASALDEGMEHAIYELVRDRLPDCTIVSVGHRSSLENLHNNELILLGDAAYDPSITPEAVAQRQGWDGITAVAEGNVVVVEDDIVITRPGPRIVDGLESLARLIHPNLFE